MAIINLKEFYPWYTHDEYIEVSDEVAAELRADKLYEAAHQRRIVRNKAQYSLDCNGYNYRSFRRNINSTFLVMGKVLYAFSDVVYETK